MDDAMGMDLAQCFKQRSDVAAGFFLAHQGEDILDTEQDSLLQSST
jgi:hypothetical protein